MAQIKPVSVTVLTREISRLFEEYVGYVQVVGEISNFKLHSSGHRYFSLKDDNAQIGAVMWRTRSLSFTPRDGMKVIVGGNVTLYPPQGKYQLDCAFMQPVGMGDLYAAFEELKRTLAQKGYFETERKKKIPAIPTSVGIITSSTGAAIQDMTSTMKRRNPLCNIVLRPTLVQGTGAAEDIVDAIHKLDSLNLDCIIIGRGGGSIEDLWAFNTDIVADAIFQCRTPIISAIGHETDFTIADFVADIRAATPTAAAEIVTPFTLYQFEEYVKKIQFELPKTVRQIVQAEKKNIEQLMLRGTFRRVRETVLNTMQYIDETESRLVFSSKRSVAMKHNQLQSLISHCKSLHPLSPLNKGFALLEKKGKVLKNNDELNIGDEIHVKRATSSALVSILSVMGKSQ